MFEIKIKDNSMYVFFKELADEEEKRNEVKVSGEDEGGDILKMEAILEVFTERGRGEGCLGVETILEVF